MDYHIQQDPGRRVLVIQPREKEWGPDYLRFGLGLATDFQGGNYFNILAQFRRTWLNRLGGEWLSEAQIGQNTFFYTEFMQPVEERGRFFVAPYAKVGQELRGVFIGDNRVGEYQTNETRVGLDAGALFGTWGEARLGGVWRRVRAHIETGPPVFPDVQETTAGLRAVMFVDQLDSAWFPRAGSNGPSGYAADEALDRTYVPTSRWRAHRGQDLGSAT